ncbi:universal stress protein [Massilia sp. G4R7]|uniref:Universal stress protein n=1 Tax=Massilia phyllostachyos TaxID=2898585 RepID=A0ABS8Q3T2_9BURK|nr:universal stress protein [Massilia phyllostachyos]MCD2516198.1 universal stress protein [Massilia phyllostachyos]
MFLERVCIATDGSDLAVRAAQMGVVLARGGAGRIVAVAVAQPRFSMPEAAGGALAAGSAAVDAAADEASLARREFERVRRAARAHLDTVDRIARAGGVACDGVAPLASSPGPEILRVAQAHGCDLIVMGAHGPNDANRSFAGSVAQYVLANSPIPVLLLRDPREAAPPDFAEPAA